MFKILIKIVKKIILSSFLIYGYNTLVEPINLIIPLNIFTSGIVSILGIPAFLSLIFLKLFIY